jgi:Tfp pilus assembly protein PilZ
MADLLLHIRFKSLESLLKSYQPQFMHGGLFVPTRKDLAAGTPLQLEIRLPSLRDSVMVAGVVAWRRAARPKEGIRGGLAVEFLSEARQRRDYLLSVARGEFPHSAQRRCRRFFAQLGVHWRQKEERDEYRSQLSDIGEGGAFINTRRPLPVGSKVILDVCPPGGEVGVAIEGRIAWSGGDGMGVEFRCRDRGGARRLKELVRRVEANTKQLPIAV